MSTELLEQKVEELDVRLRVVEEELARQKTTRPFLGFTIEEAKVLLSKPVKRTPEVIERAMQIVGICEGPEDLSVNLRDYLRGERR